MKEQHPLFNEMCSRSLRRFNKTPDPFRTLLIFGFFLLAPFPDWLV